MQDKEFTLDISKIYNGEKTEIPFAFELSKEDMTTDEAVFCGPAEVSGRVYLEADGRVGAENLIFLEIGVKGAYNAVCARCADDVTKTFNIDTKFGVAKSISETSTDYVEAPEGTLNLTEIARTVFFLELPTRILCKDNCKGLCLVCGQNLNLGTCSCKPEMRKNNPLSDLKKLLDNYEEK